MYWKWLLNLSIDRSNIRRIWKKGNRIELVIYTVNISVTQFIISTLMKDLQFNLSTEFLVKFIHSFLTVMENTNDFFQGESAELLCVGISSGNVDTCSDKEQLHIRSVRGVSNALYVRNFDHKLCSRNDCPDHDSFPILQMKQISYSKLCADMRMCSVQQTTHKWKVAK